jgi:putative phosphoesterase
LRTVIGVISDTHGLLRAEALDALRGSEHIIHAGDIGSPDILEKLSAVAPVTAVRGNIDKQEWARSLPETEVLDVRGLLIYILHDLAQLDLKPQTAGFAVVVSGHSHLPKQETREWRVVFQSRQRRAAAIQTACQRWPADYRRPSPGRHSSTDARSFLNHRSPRLLQSQVQLCPFSFNSMPKLARPVQGD